MQWPLEATALVPVLALVYATLHGSVRPSRARHAAFGAAVVLILVAFLTPLQRLALHDFLWAHLLQNVVLAEWAPGLLVLSVAPAVARRIGGLLPPVAALFVWLATYFAWHLPWLYDLALRHPHSLLHVEHLTYLVAGILFWWPVLQTERAAGAKALYLFAAFVLASPLGLLLALLPRAVYDVYRDAAPTWGLSALADQQLAGATMAAEQAIVLFGAFTLYLLRFLRDEQAAGLTNASRIR